jgi:uncharacterized protein involved in type VI secretion and phage assembly
MVYKIEIKEFEIDSKLVFEQKSTADELLLNVSLKQQMYKPSCLEVELQVKEKGISDFKGKLVTLKDKDNNTVYVKDYFITNVRKKGNKVSLTAYSADYFLTIDKFCQAFTGKTLVDGIINLTLEKCVSSNFDKFRKIAAFTNGNDKKKYVKGNVANFLISGKESIIPYAVQYNESFYDFLVRMCNRDGEFLYMDSNNNLCVGLKGMKKSSLSGKIKEDDIEYLDSYEEKTEMECSDIDYLSDEGVEYKKHEAKSTPNNYHAWGVLSPEYQEKIDTEKFYKWSDLTTWFTEIPAILKSFADKRTVYESCVASANTIVKNDVHYADVVDKNNAKYQSRYLLNQYLYSSNMENATLKRNNDGYSKVFNNQEKAKANQLRVVLTNNAIVNIGEYVVYDNIRYVIYESLAKITQNNNISIEIELLLVKETNDGFYPLPMPEIRVRKSSAQHAIVLDNYDPEALGRVRVLYPWQSIKEDNDYLQDIIGSTDFNKLKKAEKEDNIENKYRNEILNMKNSTPWIRVSYPMASEDAGFLFVPVKGDEVLIDYEDGNVERPYVCGSFYNNKNKPSVVSQNKNLGKVKSIASINGHHISFFDNGGIERFLTSEIPVLKILHSFGLLDDLVDGDKYFGGGFEISDRYGVYAIKGSTHGRCIDIKSPFGNVNIDAFTGISINAPLGDVRIVGKNVSIEARNNLTLESGTNIGKTFKEYDFKEKFLKDLCINALETGDKHILDLSLIRTISEVILRPIGGATLIKSNRFLRLEAGDGNAFSKDSLGNKRRIVGYAPTSLHRFIEKRRNVAIEFYDNYVNWYSRFVSTMNDCHTINETNNLGNVDYFDENRVKNINEILQRQEDLQNVNLSAQISNQLEIFRNLLSDKDNIISISRQYNFARLPNLNNIWREKKINQEFPSRKKFVFDFVKTCVESNDDLSGHIKFMNFNWDDRLSQSVNTYVDAEDDKKSTKRILLEKLRSSFGFDGFSEETEWKTRDKGHILLSENKEYFYRMNGDGTFKKENNKTYRDYLVELVDEVGELDSINNVTFRI